MACRASDTLRFPVGATSKPTSEALSRESSSNTGTNEMPTVSNSKTDARPMSGHPSTWTGTFVLPNKKKKKHKRKKKQKQKTNQFWNNDTYTTMASTKLSS